METTEEKLKEEILQRCQHNWENNGWRLQEIIDYVFEAGKQNVFCLKCGFPKEWERDLVILDNNIFSLMNWENNICKECGHQADGSSIKKIEPLLRQFREAGRQEALEEIEKFIENKTYKKGQELKL